MAESRFVYVIYINATPEAVFDALIKPEFTRQYWSGTHQRSDWTVGSAWAAQTPDGRVADDGQVLEFERPRRLAVSWLNHLFDWAEAEGASTAAFDIEPTPAGVKLTITHTLPRGGSRLIEAVGQGWPGVLSSLKSLLETGKALPGSDKWPEGV